MDESVRYDQARYVQHRSPGSPNAVSGSHAINPPWHGYSLDMEIHQPDTEYDFYNAFDIPESFMSSVEDFTPMDTSYQSTFPGYQQNSWINSWTHQTDEATPF
jgi:hypothetical protein